ncbi:DoxX family protein [Paenibacillus sp. GCM10023252]|uniref:DoxX family protein n=1 Tax=Paenibacillus sp. GCM10023252 TaxID=3252649 RepID=UPI0036227354
MDIVSIVLQVLLGLMFLLSAFGKLSGQKAQVDSFNHLGLPQWFRILTGSMQLIGAAGMIVGIWYADIAAIAGLWIGVIMLGAVISHLRAKDPIKAAIPGIVLFVLALAVVILNWSELMASL